MESGYNKNIGFCICTVCHNLQFEQPGKPAYSCGKIGL